MPSDVRSTLLDILDHIVLARGWTAGLTPEEFTEDRKTFYAVTRCLEIISEASRRLPADMKARAGHVAWADIRDAGNFYRHQYDQVSERIVLKTVLDGFAELDTFVRQEIARP